MNTYCLVRQEIQLLSEKLINDQYFLFFIFYFQLYVICESVHPTSHPISPKTEKNIHIKLTSHTPKFVLMCLCHIKHVNSQML